MKIMPTTVNTVFPKYYKEDIIIAQSIVKRDGRITRDFFYNKCYPLFKSIFNNYFTDCSSVYEFIDEIYILVLTPSKETGRCQLENYRGESTLATWLKTTCLFYCYHRFERKKRLPIVEVLTTGNDDKDDYSDRFLDNSYSTTMDQISTNRKDLEVVLKMMSNERYRNIIRMRYVERMTNEETAQALGMSMANYYNKHKLAKEQFASVLRKEACYE